MKDAEKELEDEFDEDGLNEEGEERKAKPAPNSADANKHELIKWRENPSLNDVTKLCIGEFEQGYSFNAYLDDRSKKDNKFVNPLDPKQQDDKGDEEEKQEDDSMGSDEEQDADMNWNRDDAEGMYSELKKDINENFLIV